MVRVYNRKSLVSNFRMLLKKMNNTKTSPNTLFDRYFIV